MSQQNITSKRPANFLSVPTLLDAPSSLRFGEVGKVLVHNLPDAGFIGKNKKLLVVEKFATLCDSDTASARECQCPFTGRRLELSLL